MMVTKSCLYILVVFIFYISKINCLTPYVYGDRIGVECKDIDGNWKYGPICANQKQELSVFYGRDSPLYCGILIDEKEFTKVSKVLNQSTSWECRVPISADISEQIYIPLSIQLWGYSIDDHLDITTHYNFIFHIENGIIIGSSLYPVKDKFQDVKKGSLFTIHGNIKWFKEATFKEYSDSFKLAIDNINNNGLLVNLDYSIITLSAILTIFICTVCFALIYRYKLKPSLIRKYLKND